MGNTPFQPANPNEEAVWATIITSKMGGRTESEVEWHLTEGVAEEVATYAVNDALDGVYAVNVYIVELKLRCSVDSDGKIIK